ncbi:AMP-binding protein [Pseudonocardia sp. NPDC049154]|uniref:AMP-binding protein n=1 Tax=Pseudonocardia sp. NPDC049154 TaxID=3155501 RepID=UPI0033EE921B
MPDTVAPRAASVLADSRRPHDPTDTQAYRTAGYWRDRTMLDDFLDHAAASPHKAAIVTYRDGSRVPDTMTYGQLATVVERIAHGLRALGVQRDEVVSIQLPNGWEFAAITLAAMRVGAVVNPLVAIFRRRELEFMLGRAGSRLLFVPDTFRGFSHAGLASELVEAVPSLEHAVVVGGEPPAGLLSFERDMLETDRSGAGPLDTLHRGPDEVVSLMYTSGTTGEPKGTLHTNNTLWSAGNPLFDSLRLTGDDVAFMASTMGHLTGFLWGMLQPLSRGMKIVFQDVWDPTAFVRLVGEEQVTWTLSATPFVVDAVAAQATVDADLSTFRYFVCAGAPIPSSLPPRATAVLGAKLMSLWGTSECGICTIHTPEATPEEVSASEGQLTGLMRVRIADDEGADVPDGSPGRLLTSGPSMFVGYLARRDLYDSVVSPDGWFDTGDVGYRTPDGGIRISGRTKDIIIRGGENIPVVEIENVLYTHPAVAEVAVVGYADERLGERACAVVVPAGAPPTLADLAAHLAENGMAKQYWPERLEIRTELPRTPAGKIQKFRLREDLHQLVGRGVFDPVSR